MDRNQNLPKILQLDNLNKLRQKFPKKKIILISGFGEPLNHTKMKALNIDGWLQKPCLFEDISEAIKKTCH